MHEHLDAFGIINMNGRVYDPLTAQFFSPDPYVQAPENWLNYNRYAYCLNNPLIYTDPTGEFIFGYASGFFRGLFSGKNPFKEGWKGGVNEVKIWGGLFVSDPNKNFGERLWEVTSRFTWQLPQTVAGSIFSHVSNYAGQVDKVEYWGGATVLSGNFWGQGGAITMGSFINGGRDLKADPHNSLFQHEYGHYIQSQRTGWGYLFSHGIPSLKSAIKAGKDPNHIHNDFWAEQDANKKGYEYFYKKYGDDLIWRSSNKINDQAWIDRIHNKYSQRNTYPYLNAPMYNPTTVYFNWAPFRGYMNEEIDEYWDYQYRRKKSSKSLVKLLSL
jgi:RHS repeat-associated protein